MNATMVGMKSVVVIASVIMASVALAQPDTLWTRVYGDGYNQEARCIIVTQDSCYLMVGKTGGGMYIVKVNRDGDLQWSRQYFAGSGNDESAANSVIQTADRGYLAAGVREHWDPWYPWDPMGIDLEIWRTDSLGYLMWNRIYSQGWELVAYAIDASDDSCYIIAGYYQPTQSEYRDAYIMKIDDQGDTLWTRTYNRYFHDRFYSVRQTAGAGFIATGYTYVPSGANNELYLVKADFYGDTLWTRTYGGSLGWCAYDVRQTNDSGYIVAGSTYIGGISDFYFVKLDSAGNELWERNYGVGYDDRANSVFQVGDNGYISVGYTREHNQPNSGDILLVRVDAAGEMLWNQRFGGDLADQGNCILQTEEGNFIIAGWTESFGAGGRDAYLIKTQSDTALLVYPDQHFPEIPKTLMLCSIYPNPFNSQINLVYDTPICEHVCLTVSDILGRWVATVIDEIISPGVHRIVWDSGDLPSGIYFVRMQAGEFVKTRKVVLLK